MSSLRSIAGVQSSDFVETISGILVADLVAAKRSFWLRTNQRKGEVIQSLDPKTVCREIVEWDIETWGNALTLWEQTGDLKKGPLECLEIGAGRGGLSLWLAQLGHNVVCSDIRDTEVTARPLIEKYGLAARVRFEDIDATEIPYRNHFDVIAFKSVLGQVGFRGHAARQSAAVASMCEALKPGGRLMFAENLVGSPLHKFLRKRFVPWGVGWRYVTVNEMRLYLRPFSRVRYSTVGFLGAFGLSERQRRLFAAIDQAGLSRLVPERWRYVMYGVATK